MFFPQHKKIRATSTQKIWQTEADKYLMFSLPNSGCGNTLLQKLILSPLSGENISVGPFRWNRYLNGGDGNYLHK
jgi:hypothetical protein